MSAFQLIAAGDGKFELAGDMSFDTADAILRESGSAFAGHTAVDVNFSRVKKADSAGLALLLEWKAWQRQGHCQVNFSAIPESVLAIARTTEVEHLL
jgi:phospholipid transport system transporter-binding protein